MRKLMAAIMLMVFLASLLSISPNVTVKAHTAGDPFVTDLIAGQNIDVGDVFVWNDETTLYVKYQTTGGWYLTETHLAVADSVCGIPKTKTGNPIPGHFLYGDYYPLADMVTYETFEIPLGTWTPGTDLYIAAHAAVAHVSSGSMLIVSDATAEWSADGLAWYPAVACWVHPVWNDIPGATWIWRTYLTDPLWEYNNVPIGGWYFRESFTLPSTAFGITATAVAANGDNAYTIAMNGVPLVPGGEGVMDKDDPNHMGWSTIINHVIPAGVITPGINELQLRAMNYYSWGDSYSNPAGLAFKVEVDYSYVDMEETAWGAGPSFPGANWATYIEYTMQGWQLVETIQVPAAQTTPTFSSATLEEGKLYKIVASGTAYAGGKYATDIQFDAEYSYTWSDPQPTVWVDGVAHYELYGPNLLDLKVEGQFIDWGSYNPAHTYEHIMTGTGSTLTLELLIYDIYYPNNSGSLTVDIFVWIE